MTRAYRGTIPGRSIIIPSLGGDFNRSPYQVQLCVELQERCQAILAAYRGSTVTLDGQQVPMDPNASFTVGGFRNPRRNVFVGSKFPVSSYHTRGRALDLTPGTAAVYLDGKRRVLSPHGIVYPTLLSAASTQGRAITEDGALPVPLGCCGCYVGTNDFTSCEDHVHVEW